jgi:hypothetical protein
MRIDAEPYPSSPGDKERRLSEVRKLIMSSTQIPDDLKNEIAFRAYEFVDKKLERGGRHTKFYGGQIGWSYYVIRNDHLDLVAALAPSASAIVAFATATVGANPIALAVTLLFAVAALGRKLKAKSASLDLVDYNVLMALKHIGPASPLELASILNGIRIYGSNMWNDERVLEVLRRLKTVSLLDGTVESFVTELPDGRWDTNGV